ncbi:MAG: ECF transporter S component, partial [Clostridia bacterium]
VGLLYSKLPKKPISIFISLISAMIAGRLVWGLASMIIYGIQGTSVFTISIFISGALLTAIPGIILQLVLIPSIILILQRAKVLPYQAVGSNI